MLLHLLFIGENLLANLNNWECFKNIFDYIIIYLTVIKLIFTSIVIPFSLTPSFMVTGV